MGRIGVWAAAIGLCMALGQPLAAGVAAAAQGEPPVGLAATAGFEGMGKGGHWVPLMVDVANRGPALSGELVANVSRPGTGGATRYELPLALAEGARKRVRMDLPALISIRDLEVGFAVAGRMVARTATGLSLVGAEDLMAGVLSREPLALSALGQVQLAGRPGSIRTVRLTEEIFPDDLRLLENFDLIALVRFDTARLRPEQLGALESWVRQGGLLVLSAGPEWRRTLGGLPPTLLPVTPTGNRTVPDLPVLAALGGKTLAESSPGIALTTSTMRFGSPLVLDGTDPVVAVARVGQGSILYFGVDLAVDPLASWSGARSMWELLLLHSRGGGLWAPRTGGARSPGAIARALDTLPTLSPPDFRRLATLFGAYLAICGPVTYLVLIWLRRRVWLWVLMPVFGLTAAAGLYWYAFVEQERGLVTHAISVSEWIPSLSRTYARTYVGVFAPSRTELRLELTPGDRVAPLPLTASGADADGQSTRVVIGDAPRADLLGLNMWSPRGLVLEREASGLEGLQFDLSIEGARLTGTVTNSTALTIGEPVVLTQGGHQVLPDLHPGGTVPVDVNLVGGRFWRPAFNRIYTLAQGSAGTYSSEELRMIRQRLVLEGSLGSTYDVIPGPVLFFGWSAQPPPGAPGVGSKNPHLNLVYTVIEPRVDPRSFDIPQGVISGRLVGAEGEQRGRSPRGYFLAEGALTFSLQLPDVDRTAIRELWLHVYTGGSPGTVTVQALDWQTGQWDELKDLAAGPLRDWDRYLARDGSLLIKVAVAQEGQEISPPTVTLRGGRA